MKRRDEVEERKCSTGTEFVEDFVDSGDGQLAKNAELVQLLVVEDATGFLRDDNHWARPW